MKKSYVCALSLGMIGVGFVPRDASAQANASDVGLAPLVMIVVDTSGSMNDVMDGTDKKHTRLTKAIAEIAGEPKINNGFTNSAYRKRSYWTCDQYSCGFQDEDILINGKVSNVDGRDSSNYKDGGIIGSYRSSVKFGFAGMNFNWDNHHYFYGEEFPIINNIECKKDLRGQPYKSKGSRDGNGSRGMWGAHKEAAAPLLYPTVSDDPKIITENNEAVINSVRSYYAFSATPIGPVLADLWYMFGGDDGKPDPCLINQPIKRLGEVQRDDYFQCRKKAVIFITDGEPCCGEGETDRKKTSHGHAYDVWHDAAHLANMGINVYTVAYSFANISPTSNIGQTMNKMAWKGNTCKDHKGTLITPDDETKFENFMYGRGEYADLKESERLCFFNAYDAMALRKAIVTALSDMLQSTISKTTIAHTDSISIKAPTHFDDKSQFINGYHNVYSGFEVTLGQIRKTHLNRETYLCNKETGEFENKDGEYIDMAKRLSCRVQGDCKLTRINDDGMLVTVEDMPHLGYESLPVPCADPNPDYPNNLNNKNACLHQRYIFAGDYSKDRYAVYADPVHIAKKDGDKVIAGRINNGTSGDKEYLIRDENGISACTSEYARSVTEYTSTANYILSPYECVSDFDCSLNNTEPRICDLGRCVDNDTFKGKECTASSNTHYCVAGYLRGHGSECTTHSGCGEGMVCHAGTCMAGTVKGCDIRSFMATQPLGTIEYASPVIVEPPRRTYRSNDYREFSKKYWNRDTMMLVGANDGMLHAFVLADNSGDGDPSDISDSIYAKAGKYKINDKLVSPEQTELLKIKEGDELWGFIPKAVMPNLHKLTDFGPQTHVNAAPVVADVPKTIDDGTKKTVEWRTVAVGGLRDGGRGYYALDITNPASPEILWEIDNTWQPGEKPDYPEVTDYNKLTKADVEQNLETNPTYKPFYQLGNTYAQPLITNMLIGDELTPVAILPGGLSEAKNHDNEDQIGRTLYIVRLFPDVKKKNLLVRTFKFNNEITGAPSVFPGTFNSIAQQIYLGDNRGALYRLDVRSPNTQDWGGVTDDQGMQLPIFDPAKISAMGSIAYEKITHAPATTLFGRVEGSPIIQVSFGTGSNDNFNINAGDNNYVASFFDYPVKKEGKITYQLNYSGSGKGKPYDPTLFVFNPPTNVQNAEAEIEGGGKFNIYTADPKPDGTAFQGRQKMTGAPIIYNYQTYFPTFVADASSDALCAAGHANIFRISPHDVAAAGDYSGGHKKLTNVQNKADDVNKPFDRTSMVQLAQNTKIYGMKITRQLFCGKNSKDGNNSYAAPQLLVQTGAKDDTLRSASNLMASNKKLNPINSSALDLEGIAPETKPIRWAASYE